MSAPDFRTPGSDPRLAAAFGALFEADAELEPLERMLLAWCVHPDGSGASRAWMLRWDGSRESWIASASADREAAPGRLAEELQRARRAPVPVASERPVAVAATSASEAWRTAWRESGTSWLPGHDDTGPWSAAPAAAMTVMHRGTQPFGVIVAEWTDGAPSRERLGAMQALRRLGTTALAAQARAHEARRRGRLAAGVAEFAAGLATSINLAEARHLFLRLAVQGAVARGGALWTCSPEGALELVLTNGPAPLRDRFAVGFAATAEEVRRHARASSGERGDTAHELPVDVAGEVSAWLAAPVVSGDRVLGVLLVWDGLDRSREEAGFDRFTHDHLATLANQAALLFEHARSRDDLASGERQREELRRRLHAQDQLATLGELATRVAHEARNPIASIGAFARRAHRALPEGDPQREYLEIVIREAERLEAMVREQLQYAALERPRLQVQDLNGVVQEVLRGVGESLVRRRVRLVKKLGPDLPRLLLDAPRMRRVLENVLAFALENVLVGGRIRVESRRAGAYVVIEVAHDGPRSAGDLLEHLFVPFASGSAAGAAVGLGVAQQIVREHGGEIRVRSEGEWSAIFSCTLPVRENEDRRRAPDRRAGRNERRRRPAA